jgi:hypothetical protein
VPPTAHRHSVAAPNRYQAVAYRRTPVPSTRARHVANRFSYGLTPALGRDIRRAGGGLAWFEEQLHPERIGDSFAGDLDSWWPALRESPQTLWSKNVAETQPLYEVMWQYARWTLLRRIYSSRQLHEVMTEVWQNMLHIPSSGGPEALFRVDYDRVVRRHALGRFETLLTEAVTHPAMLVFLDQAVSTATHPNENLGRELLELHTVGRAAYTEADVLDSARILTGWRVDMWNSWDAYYDERAHWTGPVRVLGFTDANGESDGRALTRRYLAYLARHPETARRVARRLAVRFVSDDPPRTLVEDLARVYLRHDTEIKPVLRALVRSDAFRAAVGRKARTPVEDVVATYRVLGARVGRPRADDHAANAILWQAQALGQRPFGWPRPDGDPDSAAAWTSASRMLGSFQFHTSMGGGWWPSTGIRHRAPRAWAPVLPIRFDQLVDHMSRTVLGRPSTDRLLKACCQATDIAPRERITADHQLLSWKMPWLLATLLDTPAHMSR